MPISPAPPVDSTAQVLAQWNMVYDAHNEVACLILGTGIERFDLIQTFHACKQDEGKSVSSNFAGFVRNYNMHNMEKIIGELHALLIEYEKCLPKKAAIQQVMAIQGVGIQKANKKSLNAKGKEHPKKDDACHHYKEVGHCKRNCPAYLAELIKKKKQVGIASSSETATRILNMVPTKKVDKTPYELWYGKVPNLSYLKIWGCEALVKRDTPDKLQQRSVKCIFIGYPKKTMGYYFYFPPGNKIVVARYAEFLEKNLISQEVSRRAEELEEIQNKDTSPSSENTSKIPMGLKVSTTSRGSCSMQSLKDNQVWRLVDLPPNGKTVGSKWLFKKKTDMDGNVHTYKARLVAKSFTQTYGVDYEETFSPIDDIRVIRILVVITAIRSLNKRFDEEIKRFGFAQNLDESCVYQKASGSNVTFLNLYVDDIIIMRNHIPSLQSVKSYLGKCFAMKDLGEVSFIRGIKIYRDRSKRLIGLSQSAYMDKILKRFRMDTSKRGYIPMQERLDLNKTQGASTPEEVKRMQNVPYASANPREPHWTAVKTILKYIRNTKDMFLIYGRNPEAELRVDCYCDAGFVTDRDDTKSQTIYLNNIAASEAAMEAVWIRKFILRLGIVPTINKPIKMFCDNSAALLIANEPGVQRGARHYHRRYHYIRECIELGEINLLKVHTDENLADLFTKALSKGKLTQHARSMGLRLASSFM
ncbi:retrotransposon protein, putative, ty1-copia subclass [Tanacetum coccineum]